MSTEKINVLKPSQKCLDLIRQFEGLFLNSYPDPATHGEPYTIGYGTTVYPNGKKVKLGEHCSLADAEIYLQFEVTEKAKGVLVPTTIEQAKFDAIVSFAYNVGVSAYNNSTLRKMIFANPDNPAIKNEWMKWNRANKKVMAGLTRRRAAEYALYSS